MRLRGVYLTLSLIFLTSAITVTAQKNKVAPSPDTSAKEKDKQKNKEKDGNVLKGWVDGEVSIIMSEEERKAFKGLKRDEERENFIENFWIRRDPTPDSPENEFRDDFYERVEYANDHFTSGIAGSRTDRGKMYILNGPPDEIESHPSGGAYYRPPEEGGGFTNTFPFETWRYRHLDGGIGKGENVIYEFVDQSMSGEFKLEYDPGAKDALRNVPGAGLTDYELANGLDKADRMKKGNTLMGAMSADIPNVNGSNEFDQLEKFNNAYRPPDVKYHDIVIPAQARLSKSQVPFRHAESYIRVTSDSSTVKVPITIQVLTKDFSFEKIDDARVASVHITGSISRADGRRYQGFSNDLKVVVPEKDFINRLEVPQMYQTIQYLGPGKYKVVVSVEDKKSQNIGFDTILLTVPRIPEQTLQASSMILAAAMVDLPKNAIGNEQFALGDKKVFPNVTGVFRRDQNLNVWQEIYGLTVDSRNKASAKFELTISQNKQVVKKIETDSTELAGAGSHMNYVNSVPLSDMNPGQYDVELRVIDKMATDTSFVTAGKFTISGGAAR
jgi:GWxTD domain-containing protein